MEYLLLNYAVLSNYSPAQTAGTRSPQTTLMHINNKVFHLFYLQISSMTEQALNTTIILEKGQYYVNMYMKIISVFSRLTQVVISFVIKLREGG